MPRADAALVRLVLDGGGWSHNHEHPGDELALVMEGEVEAFRQQVLKHDTELGFRGFGGHGGFDVEAGGGQPVGAGDLKIFYSVGVGQEALQGDPGVVNAAWVGGAGASWGASDDYVRRARGGWLYRGGFESQLSKS